ncbi:hypothetical protein, partial [Escherichia coli]|uniref:hypothetical protein n=1 Tax=Escherichia coli TaxID=562 RepID=UPI00116D5055
DGPVRRQRLRHHAGAPAAFLAPLNAAARRLRQAWRGARQNAGMTTQNTPASPRLAGHALVEALIAQGVDTVFGVPGESY